MAASPSPTPLTMIIIIAFGDFIPWKSLIAFKLTAANVDDRTPVPDMTQDIVGKLFGDRGYISHKLFEELYERGLQLITKLKKNMKNKLVPLIDKILLRKRAVIESVNDQLKVSPQ